MFCYSCKELTFWSPRLPILGATKPNGRDRWTRLGRLPCQLSPPRPPPPPYVIPCPYTDVRSTLIPSCIQRPTGGDPPRLVTIRGHYCSVCREIVYTESTSSVLFDASMFCHAWSQTLHLGESEFERVNAACHGSTLTIYLFRHI